MTLSKPPTRIRIIFIRPWKFPISMVKSGKQICIICAENRVVKISAWWLHSSCVVVKLTFLSNSLFLFLLFLPLSVLLTFSPFLTRRKQRRRFEGRYMDSRFETRPKLSEARTREKRRRQKRSRRETPRRREKEAGGSNYEQTTTH